MAGALLTILLLMIGLIGGLVSGSIIRTRRMEGVGLALAALVSTYIAGSASSVGIQVGFFAIVAVEILACYIDSGMRAREAQKPK